MEVVAHCIAPLPPQNPDLVWVHLCREECHHPYCLEGPCANVFGGENDCRSRRANNGLDGGHDFVDSDLYPLVILAHGCERIHAGGSVVSKICDAETQFRHRTALGVERYPVANGISLDTIFCILKRRLENRLGLAWLGLKWMC